MMPKNRYHYLPFLDGLRGVAALLVVVSHYSNRAGAGMDLGKHVNSGAGMTSLGNLEKVLIGALGSGAGQLGVMIFFTLSAFLMAFHYGTNIGSGPQLRSFVISRIARIFPLYFAAVLLVIVANAVLPFAYLPFDTPTAFRHLAFMDGQSVLWTIRPELGYYALFALVWYLGGYQTRWPFWVSLAVVLGLNLLPVVGKSFAFDFFALGNLVFFYFLAEDSRVRAWARHLAASWVALPTVALVSAVMLPAIHRQLFGPLTEQGWDDYIYLVFVFFLFAAVLDPGPVQRMFSSKPLRFLGKISFSVYIIHLLVLNAAFHYGFARLALLPMMVTVLAVVATSWLSYRFIEQPARRVVTAKLTRLLTPKPKTEAKVTE